MLPTAAFGGAVLVAAAGLGAETINLTAALRAREDELGRDLGQALFEISQILGSTASGVGLGVFALATAAAALRGSVVLPRWVSVVLLDRRDRAAEPARARERGGGRGAGGDDARLIAIGADFRAGGLLTGRPANTSRLMFEKVLVANRGEIAIRVMRTLEELGVGSVGVYSEPDREAPHARRATESYLLGPGPAAESYLNVEKLLEVADQSGAQAVHPGYGFLAENAPFARAVEKAGLVWIGPPADAIDAMGSKTRARELMKEAGVPIVPGTTDPVEDVEAARKIIDESVGYPVAIKAAGGGGGKGFRVAETEDELEKAFEGAAREGEKFFSDATVYVERYLPDPRHVEVQVLADSHGNVIHLFERDCSVQRRHQKVIEESPAPAVDPELRERIGKIGVDAAKAVNYRSAGTMEGLLQDGEYFFLEMNTRVQVEHCVTEMVTGIDIVREQIKVAAGEELAFGQDDVEIRGHAIECRINAEDASKNFAPAPGKIGDYREPSAARSCGWTPAPSPATRCCRCTTR